MPWPTAFLISVLLLTGCGREPRPIQDAGAADPNGLAKSVRTVTEAITRSQNRAGYWETPVTLTPRFENPAPEVNVFTTAIMADLLEPIAGETGLSDVLARARGYLRAQIESTGLARYHGDPGPLDPGAVGCELPPDADDTALIWRIAPPADPARLQAARRTLEQYRTGDGLYVTWLADRQRYDCFYTHFFPRDPNPPDVGIQMHVYLFLARYDPEAAGRLCAALRPRLSDGRLWVWYAVAPFLPLVREVDLTRAGCPITLPESMLRKAVTGQDAYMTQARLFRDLSLGADPGPFARATAAALREVADGNFNTLMRTPPLLYHNALSAEPPHYHWSTEVGYALWLRLYVELTHRTAITADLK